jgi:ribosome-binding protein aMBF1 (putative translation factor)
VNRERWRAKVSKKAMRDELDELVDELALKDPDLPRILDLQSEARELVRELVKRRKRAGLSRAELAQRMGIRSAKLVRMERGQLDPRLSMVANYLAIVGGDLVLPATDPPVAALQPASPTLGTTS